MAEETLASCADTLDKNDRYACYDRAFSVDTDRHSKELLSLNTDLTYPEDNQAANFLERTWELTDEYKVGQFRFRPYQFNYLLLWRKSNNMNQNPYSPTQTTSGNTDTLADELNYQLSFKTKLSQNIFDTKVDLWFAYTQQSYWQIYNQSGSSPFRETDYEPELILSIPLNIPISKFNLKLLNVGVSHQSNGRAEPYSRSWNRLFAQAGFEHDNLLISAKVWKRINETASNDDNPDINDYLGNADLRFIWFIQDSAVSSLFRYSLTGKHGSIKLNWSFTLRNHLKGFAEVFSGYGDNLIDYNHKQNIFGIGFLITTWP